MLEPSEAATEEEPSRRQKIYCNPLPDASATNVKKDTRKGPGQGYVQSFEFPTSVLPKELALKFKTPNGVIKFVPSSGLTESALGAEYVSSPSLELQDGSKVNFTVYIDDSQEARKQSGIKTLGISAEMETKGVETIKECLYRKTETVEDTAVTNGAGNIK